MSVIENASAVGNIGFPEFTTKLVNDTINTLISNQARQTEAFLELTDEVAKTLTEYINDTKDDVTGEEVLAFISSLVPSVDTNALAGDDTEEPLANSSPEEIDALNEATTVDQGEVDNLSTNPTTDSSVSGSPNLTDSSSKSDIVTAIINRLSINKYQFLREIVQQGLVRLVVENGMIETSLNMTTSEFTSLRRSSSSYGRRSKSFGLSASGNFYGKALQIGVGANYSKIDINTKTSDVINNSSEQVTISGRVKINFASDYKELANV